MKDLKLDEHTGLVLEGGGMRGVFTCGVLDYLMACRMHPVSVVVPSSAILTCWRNTIISA